MWGTLPGKSYMKYSQQIYQDSNTEDVMVKEYDS
jgi:hypothetical protein